MFYVKYLYHVVIMHAYDICRNFVKKKFSLFSLFFFSLFSCRSLDEVDGWEKGRERVTISNESHLSRVDVSDLSLHLSLSLSRMGLLCFGEIPFEIQNRSSLLKKRIHGMKYTCK